MGDKHEIIFKITPIQSVFPISNDPERENALNRIAETFSEWPGTYFERALQAGQSGRETDILNAISLLDKAIELDHASSFPELLVEKGNFYMQLRTLCRQTRGGAFGNDDFYGKKIADLEHEAEKCFLSAVSKAPHDYRANAALAFFYFDAKKTQAALEGFKSALDACRKGEFSNEMRAVAHANVATCLLAMDPPDEKQALAYFDHALRLDEDNCKRWADKGVILYRMNRIQDAADHVRQALSRNPPEELVSILKEIMLQCENRKETRPDA